MAGITIKMTLDDAGSVKKKTNETKALNSELGKTTKLASQAMKASAAEQSMTGTGYGRARGTVGTGAEGRDFANQAQGLGGLVRLYATYAANLFAVGAAFTALSNAMDTTNMVEGLNQLGAASGVALGTLAKKFAEASGGAISLREAMGATTKAISSGLSEKQFLQIGEVAKKASQALGIDMADAVSRLTRGITKLEPELLDELGLFTKIGPATEAYAKSIGKSVSALTDIERRQAFANATIQEGIDKFNEIDIPTNPYSKLLATLKDVAQIGLAGINTLLGPLVNLLSSSPTALTGIIAALGVTLVKQAIPAIGEYRKGLNDIAANSQAVYKQRADTATKALKIIQDTNAKEILAEKAKIDELKVARVDEAESNLKLIAKRGGRISSAAKEILGKSVIDTSEKDLAVLDKLGTKQTALAGTYRELAKTIREAKQANLEYIATEEKLAARANKPPGRFTAAGIAQQQAERARRASESRTILSDASNSASTLGPVAAFKELNTKVTAANLGVLSGTFTRVAGTANIAASAVMGIASALQVYIFAAVAVGAVVKFIIDYFSNAEEESTALKTSIETLNSATVVSADTFKRYGDSISSAAIQAKTTAFTGLADSILESANALGAFNEKANGVTQFKQFVLGIFGKDFESEIAEGLSNSVSKGLQNIVNPATKKQVQEDLKSILGGKAIEDLTGTELAKVSKSIATLFDKASKEGTKLSNSINGVNTGFTELDSSFTSLTNSLINKDLGTKFATDLIAQSAKLAEAFKDPIAGASILDGILKDTGKIRMFPPETQASILDAAKNFVTLNAEIAKYSAQADVAKGKIDGATNALNNLKNLTGKEKQEFITLKIRAEGDLAVATQGITAANSALSKINTNLNAGFKTAIISAFDQIQAPLVAAMSKGSIEVQKTLLDRLPKTAGTIMTGAKLDIAAIEIDKQQLVKTQELINQLELNRLSQERLSLEEQKRAIIASGGMEGVSTLTASIAKLQQQERARTKGVNLTAEIKAGTIDRTPEIANILKEQIGAQTQLAQFGSKQQQIRFGAEVDAIAAGFDKVVADLNATVVKLDSDFKNLSTVGLTKAEIDARKEKFEADKQAKLNEIELESGPKKTRAVAAAVLQRAPAGSALSSDAVMAGAKAMQEETTMRARQAADAAGVKQANEIKRALEAQLIIYTEVDARRASSTALREQEVSLAEQMSNIGRDRLAIELENGVISQDSYNMQVRALDKLNITKTKENQLNAVNEKYTSSLIDVGKDIANNNYEITDAMKVRMATAAALYEQEVLGINRVAEAQAKNLELQDSLTVKQKDMLTVFEDSFSSMADALVEFAKTGKISFSSLVEDMLAGLLKVELQAQATQAFSAMKPGITSFLTNIIPSFFGGSPVGSINNSMTQSQMLAAQTAGFAKGGAFDTMGLQEFAKGGAFTNSIVDSPTMFKFAKGTGLMGEAGPEAIMPLKRDANGTLGVRTNGGGTTTSVVVNNYSSEKAETKETVDSRGNRRVEIVVGEMIAGEVSRNGSAVNNSIRGTFGSKPTLIRR